MILLIDFIWVVRWVLVFGNFLKVKCGILVIMQLMVGLNDVGVWLLVMLFCSLLRVQLIVSLVVILVIGKLVVLEVRVEEWEICGFILIIIMCLVFGQMLNCMLELLVFMLILCNIVSEVLCMIWYFLLVRVCVGVMVIELLVCMFIGLKFLMEQMMMQLFFLLWIIFILYFFQLISDLLISSLLVGDRLRLWVQIFLNFLWLQVILLLVLFMVKDGWMMQGKLICLSMLQVFFMLWVMFECGQVRLIFFIVLLKCEWFLVLLMVLVLVLIIFMLNFFSMLWCFRFRVQFNVVWLFMVGSSVLGCFFLMILVMVVYLIGLMQVVLVIVGLVMMVVGLEFIRMMWQFFLCRVLQVWVLEQLNLQVWLIMMGLVLRIRMFFMFVCFGMGFLL